MTKYWDKNGVLTDTENKAACAATELENKEVAVFVKYDGSGNVFDPYGLYYKDGDEWKDDDRRGGKVFKFKQVSHEAYRLYMEYLKKGREKYLMAMKQEMMNYG